MRRVITFGLIWLSTDMSSKHKLEAGSCVIVKGEVISPRRRNPKKPVHRAAQYHICTAWEAENPLSDQELLGSGAHACEV